MSQRKGTRGLLLGGLHSVFPPLLPTSVSPSPSGLLPLSVITATQDVHDGMRELQESASQVSPFSPTLDSKSKPSRRRCNRNRLGQDQSEVCERCAAIHGECITVKRRVGRQAGVKNRKRKSSPEEHDYRRGDHVVPLLGSDSDHLPNPLQVLASEAVRRHRTPEYVQHLFAIQETAVVFACLISFRVNLEAASRSVRWRTRDPCARGTPRRLSTVSKIGRTSCTPLQDVT